MKINRETRERWRKHAEGVYDKHAKTPQTTTEETLARRLLMALTALDEADPQPVTPPAPLGGVCPYCNVYVDDVEEHVATVREGLEAKRRAAAAASNPQQGGTTP
jgi:hypothetical protein